MVFVEMSRQLFDVLPRNLVVAPIVNCKNFSHPVKGYSSYLLMCLHDVWELTRDRFE